MSFVNTTINTEYFAGSQAALFIGDIWVDDIVQYDYSTSINSTPIYGYGSVHFDQVINGQIVIQGTFAINFREPNYLFLIIQEHNKYLVKEFAKENPSVSGNANINDPYSGATSFSDTQAKRANIDFFFKNRDGKVATDHLQKKHKANKRLDPVRGDTEFLLSAPFTLKFEYGENGVYEQLEHVKILGTSKIIDSTGQPIKEVYRFVARKKTCSTIA